MSQAPDSLCSARARGEVLTQRWPVLESVTRTCARQPNIAELGMMLDKEVARYAVGQLADATLRDRLTLQ
jgi:hypothetical protein